MEHHRAVQAARVAAWKVSSGSRKEKRVWPEAEPDIMEEPPERRSCITIRMTAIEMLLIHQHSEIGNILCGDRIALIPQAQILISITAVSYTHLLFLSKCCHKL